MRDYYKILGVDKNASEEEIKKAYRHLAHQHHPDKVGGDEKKFKEINEAYQVLSDKKKREMYDRFGTADPMAGFGGFRQGTAWNGFTGFDAQGFPDLGDFGDVFESLFENLGVRPRRRTYSQGSDLEFKEEVTLEEAFHGAVKRLRFNTLIGCAACKGHGADAAAGFTKCAACGGQGKVRVERQTFFGNFSQVKRCTQCHGTGHIPNKVCSSCKGKGKASGEREVNVEILPGVEDNQVIKVKGMGEAGEQGNASGDLYIRVNVKPHAVFERRGDDLVVKKELKVGDLLLGKKIDVPTISGGTLHVDIPPHFNLKDDLRIRGEGMPRFNSFGRGDLLANLTLKAPKRLSPRAKKILEEIEKEL